MTKGYYVHYSYLGWVPWLKRYIRFATEEEYLNYISEHEEEEQ